MTDTIAATEELKKALAAEEGARRWVRRLAIVFGIVLAVGAGLAWSAQHRPPPAARFTTVPVAVGDVLENVQATGTVQPLLQVNVGTQVNGRVTQVLVDYNSVVKKGDLLAEIDPLIYGTQVSAQQANLLASRAQLEQAKASAASTQGAARHRAHHGRPHREALRAEPREPQRSRHGEGQLRRGERPVRGLDGHRPEPGGGPRRPDRAAPPVDGEPRLHEDLLAGRRRRRHARHRPRRHGAVELPGRRCSSSSRRTCARCASWPTSTRPTSARSRTGWTTDCVVDAFPGEIFRGKISQVRFSPNNVSGVVTYSAVVDVDNPDEKLRPGMTTTITVHTHEAHGVPRMPNAALRYRPTPPLGPDGKPVLQPPEPALPKGQGRVWVLTSDKPGDEKDEMRVVSVGITDGIFTEVTDPSLGVGTRVVTDETDADDKKKKRIF